MISNLCGKQASSLGLAAKPNQDPKCVDRAFETGINYFFFYGPSDKPFIERLKPLLQSKREEIIVASGSGARKRHTLKNARRNILNVAETEMLDVFFAEYINPSDDPQAIFGKGGVLDELQEWKVNGWIRYVGATAHDRKLAERLAKDARVDLLMHRFNMAHRKAAREVFPASIAAQTPIIAFTATRWGTLLKPQPDYSGEPPSAVDCYRYCLAQPAVEIALSAPQSLEELNENLRVLELPMMSKLESRHWEQYGDFIYGLEKEADAFESRWP